MEVSLRACLRNSKGPCLPVRSLSHTFVVGQCPGTSVLAEKDRAAQSLTHPDSLIVSWVSPSVLVTALPPAFGPGPQRLRDIQSLAHGST